MTSAASTGRVRLAVTPGERPVVAVHELGAPGRDREQWLSRAQQSWGAWIYAQRGHAPSGWAVGRIYRVSDFAVDLVRLLHNVIAVPCLLVGAGAGGLVAMLAAAAAPECVAGLHLQPAVSGGWGADPDCVVTEGSVLNRAWLDAVQSESEPRAALPGDDPVLTLGPAEKMYRPAVRAAAAKVLVPWSVEETHFLGQYLPAANRSARPLVEGSC